MQNLIKLPVLIISELGKLHSSHQSVRSKEYLLGQMIDREEDENLKTNMRAYWQKLNKPKAESTLWSHPDLQLDKQGNIMTNKPSNLFHILNEHPEFNQLLSYNELTRQFCYGGKEIHDLDYTQLRTDLCRKLKLTFAKSDVIDLAELVAQGHTYHPIKQYLTKLTWDGEDRIPHFLNAMQIEINDLNISAITKWLTACVARIMVPGSKVDSIPVFQGPTGYRKSTAIQSMVPDAEWFSDEPVDFGSKDAKQVLLGKWLVELAELSSFNRKDNNLIKSDITQTVDEFRSPYDRKPKKYPRQFVYVGTTNDLEFLTDPTSNRRFWIFEIMDVIDTDKIVEMRDHLWAQAFSMFSKGEKWYLTKEEEYQMSLIASNYEVKDAWFDTVQSYLIDRDHVTTSEVLNHIKPVSERIDNKDRARVVKIMQFMKWHNTTMRVDGTPTCVWRKSTERN